MNILNNPSKFQDFHAIEVVLEPSTWIIALNFEAQNHYKNILEMTWSTFVTMSFSAF